jgi:hypothetical protein
MSLPPIKASRFAASLVRSSRGLIVKMETRIQKWGRDFFLLTDPEFPENITGRNIITAPDSPLNTRHGPDQPMPYTGKQPRNKELLDGMHIEPGCRL